MNSRDSALVRDRFYCLRRGFGFRDDPRARVVRRARVAHAHRNIFIDRRLNRFRMQHFRAEVSKFSRFLIRQHGNRFRFGHDPWISGQHATHISPDLNLARIERRADERSREIRSPASKCRCDAAHRAADETPEHWNLRRFKQRQHFVPGGLLALRQRRGSTIALIGFDASARIDLPRGQPMLAQDSGQQLRGKLFTIGDDLILKRWRGDRMGGHDSMKLANLCARRGQCLLERRGRVGVKEFSRNRDMTSKVWLERPTCVARIAAKRAVNALEQ